MKFNKGNLLFFKKGNWIHFVIQNDVGKVMTLFVAKRSKGIILEFHTQITDKTFMYWKIYQNGEFVNEI